MDESRTPAFWRPILRVSIVLWTHENEEGRVHLIVTHNDTLDTKVNWRPIAPPTT
jgi:hypothetical protein